MDITPVALYYVPKEQTAMFDRDNRDANHPYFASVITKNTNMHFIGTVDFVGDEHRWLVDMSLIPEDGYEITFTEQDKLKTRNDLAQFFLKNDYYVCSWADKMFVQPKEERIHEMVKTDIRVIIGSVIIR